MEPSAGKYIPVDDFYLEFEEDLSFFAYSEVLKNWLQGDLSQLMVHILFD